MVIIFAVIGLAIQYLIMKAAVFYGTIEAMTKLDQHNQAQMKEAVYDGVKAAIAEGENQFLIGLHNTIQDAIKAASESKTQ